MSLRLFSRAWQVITKLKNLYDKLVNIIFHPFAGGSLLDRLFFLQVGWHPRRDHAYQILSRSLGGYGATGVQTRGFPIHFQSALTTVFRTTVLHCDKYSQFKDSPINNSLHIVVIFLQKQLFYTPLIIYKKTARNLVNVA